MHETKRAWSDRSIYINWASPHFPNFKPSADNHLISIRLNCQVDFTWLFWRNHVTTTLLKKKLWNVTIGHVTWRLNNLVLRLKGGYSRGRLLSKYLLLTSCSNAVNRLFSVDQLIFFVSLLQPSTNQGKPPKVSSKSCIPTILITLKLLILSKPEPPN